MGNNLSLPIFTTIILAVVSAIYVGLINRPNRKKILPPPVITTLSSKAKPHDGDIHRSSLGKEKLQGRWNESISTLYEGFQNGVKYFGENNCMGTRFNDGPFVWKTYKEINERLTDFGSGLLNLGLASKDFIGIYSQNREEWVVAEQSCNAYNMCSVPLYDTLGADACKFIVNHVKLPAIVFSKDKVKMIQEILSDCPSVKFLIQMDPKTSDQPENYGNVKLLSFTEVEELGKTNRKAHIPPLPSDVATICFTSGTTGNPKGAMITHGNMIADVTGAYLNGINLYSTDFYLSYLPLAHMMERIVQVLCWSSGVSVGFFRGDVLKLFDDLALLRPTFFVSVPRLFNRIYDKIQAGVAEAGGFKKTLFDIAYQAKLRDLGKGYITHPLWDALIFNKIRARLGGRVRLMLTGSAPISPEVHDFLRICFCCPVLEGYGQTECTAGASVSHIDDLSVGHVGFPLACNEIKLVSIPEMDYYVTDNPPRGEICFRGLNVFLGYYGDPEKTKEALDEDGWLHSGDVGTWLPTGQLKVFDRKKSIFKLSQGEYVAPEKIENVYQRSSFVAQCFIHGDSLKSALIAIVVPDKEVVTVWAKKNEISNADDFDALCKNSTLHKAVTDSMNEVAKEAKLKGFEVAKKVFLSSDAFSVENDLLTPTFKLKRVQAKVKYSQVIAELYKDID